MSGDVAPQALTIAQPLVDLGYDPVEEYTDVKHFGSGWLTLVRGDVRVRVLNDRGEWFIEIGSLADLNDWFDARLVLREVGADPVPAGTDRTAVQSLCAALAQTAPHWEVMFSRIGFDAARKSLRAREAASARERFGIGS